VRPPLERRPPTGPPTSKSEGLEAERAEGARRRSATKPKSTALKSTATGVAGEAVATAPKPRDAPSSPIRDLTFWQSMLCGAVSRSVSQTLMHPANAMKTILQTSRMGGSDVTVTSLVRPSNLRRLTNGAGAQFVLSLPQGAINYAVLESVRAMMRDAVARSDLGEAIEKNGVVGACMDFMASATSTICCSTIANPISMVNENIMAGAYPNFPRAVAGIASERGFKGFYTGWWPSQCSKIPSYGLTWVCFQRIKEAHSSLFDRPANDMENSAMGCLASGIVVCVMMPMDTIKTRLMTQALNPVPYQGMRDCAVRMLSEEGMASFYRGLTPRLISVVPTVGIQFGVYEFMKRLCLESQQPTLQEAK